MKRHIVLYLLLLPFLSFAQLDPINIGANPNDGTGDPLRIAFEKVNANDVYLEQLLNSLTPNLQEVIDAGNTHYDTVGDIGIKLDGGGLYFTDGIGTGNGRSYINSNYLAIGNGSHIGRIHAHNLTAFREYALPDKPGTIALIDDISNIYTTDGTLTGDRKVLGDNFNNAIYFQDVSEFGVVSNGINLIAENTKIEGINDLTVSIGGSNGTSGQVLTSDGVNTTWQDLPSGGKFIDGTNPLDAVYLDGNVGVGTQTPNAKLEIVSNGSNSTDLIFSTKNNVGKEFLKVNEFGSVWSTGNGSYNDITAYGYEAGLNTQSYNGTYYGAKAGKSNTSGNGNTFIGGEAGLNNTTGWGNTFLGYSAGGKNNTGTRNVFIGYLTAGGNYNGNTTGSSNVAIGSQASRANNGSNNITIGQSAGSSSVNSSSHVVNVNNSILIGTNSKPFADNSTNEIVIGHEAGGNGSNTATLGNDNITDTYLKGDTHATSFVLTSPNGTKYKITVDNNGNLSTVTY